MISYDIFGEIALPIFKKENRVKKIATGILFFLFMFGNQTLEAQSFCQEHKKEISDFISKFENLQKKHQARAVLNLFTPAIEEEDMNDYYFFAGLDTAGPRLYSTGTTAFGLVSFKIVDVYQSWANGCIVNVVEKRKYYPHGAYWVTKAWTHKHVLNFELLYGEEDKVWRVDRYSLYVIGASDKFSGFEF